MSDDHHQRILEKLRRLDKLAQGASTESEREAAESARRRLVEKLETKGVHVAPELAAEVGIDGAYPLMNFDTHGPTTEVEAEDPFEPRAPTLVAAPPGGPDLEASLGLSPESRPRQAQARAPTRPDPAPPVYEEDARARTVLMGIHADDLLDSMPPASSPPQIPVHDLRSGFYPAAGRNPNPSYPPPPHPSESLAGHPAAARRGGRPPPRASTAANPGPPSSATLPPSGGPRAKGSFGWKKLLIGVIAFAAGLEVTRSLLKPDDLSLAELYTAREQSVAQATSACLEGDQVSCSLLGTRISTHAGRWASPEERSSCAQGESDACRSLGRRFSLESKARPAQRGEGYSAVACALGSDTCSE